MQLQIQTSVSEMIPIQDFKLLCDLAKCSKCHVFVLLKNINKLFGAVDECASIHEIDVPFAPNTDLVFRLDQIEFNLLDKYDNFFIPDKFNWVILPDYYWGMYIAGDLEAVYIQDKYYIIDKGTKTIIDQIHMYRYVSYLDHQMNTMLNQLEGFIRRQYTLSENIIVYESMQDHPDIRKVFDSRAATSRNLIKLDYLGNQIMFYLYKSLFTLNKSDILNISIRFDIYDARTFMTTFEPIKKKNPLQSNIYNAKFKEKIHCMFVNLL